MMRPSRRQRYIHSDGRGGNGVRVCHRGGYQGLCSFRLYVGFSLHRERLRLIKKDINNLSCTVNFPTKRKKLGAHSFEGRQRKCKTYVATLRFPYRCSQYITLTNQICRDFGEYSTMTAIATKEDGPLVWSGHLRDDHDECDGSVNNGWEYRDHSFNHGDGVPLW